MVILLCSRWCIRASVIHTLSGPCIKLLVVNQTLIVSNSMQWSFYRRPSVQQTPNCYDIDLPVSVLSGPQALVLTYQLTVLQQTLSIVQQWSLNRTSISIVDAQWPLYRSLSMQSIDFSVTQQIHNGSQQGSKRSKTTSNRFWFPK